MNMVNTRSKIAHSPDCHFVSRISDVNLGCYENTFYAAKDGFRVCKCCNKMVKSISKQESEMMEFCQDKAMSCRIENEELIIATPYSQWKAHIGNKGNYDLYHRNTRGNTNCYHLQTKRYSDAMDMLKYIDEHDQYRLYNPLPEKHTKQKPKPRKGTKRYRKAMRKAEAAKQRNEVRRVLDLIDSLAMA